MPGTPRPVTCPCRRPLEPGNRWNGLLEAIGTFINGAELECASLRDYQRYSPGRGPDPRIREGYGHLVASYGTELPVTFGAAVTQIDHGGRDIRISTGAGTITARAVVVTVPSNSLAAESLRFDPPLPAKTTAAAALPLGLCNKLFLGVPEDIELPAEHYLMGSTETVRTASYHIRPFGRRVIECYFGGQLARDMEREGAPGLCGLRAGGTRPASDAGDRPPAGVAAHVRLGRHAEHRRQLFLCTPRGG